MLMKAESFKRFRISHNLAHIFLFRDYYFCEKVYAMGGHKEAEQNEIGGPVVFAVILVVLAITVIYFLS